VASGQSGDDHWESPTAEWALAGGLTLFCSIIGKHAGWILSTSLSPEVASGQSGDDHWDNPTAEWALAGGLTLFCSIIGKHAGWILSTSLSPEVASGQSGEDHLCLAPIYARPAEL